MICFKIVTFKRFGRKIVKFKGVCAIPSRKLDVRKLLYLEEFLELDVDIWQGVGPSSILPNSIAKCLHCKHKCLQPHGTNCVNTQSDW